MASEGQFDLSATIEKGHNDRGSGLTEGSDPSSPSFPREPDEFDGINWAGEFSYGAEGARGRLNFGLGGSQLDYTNNIERTAFFIARPDLAASA